MSNFTPEQVLKIVRIGVANSYRGNMFKEMPLTPNYYEYPQILEAFIFRKLKIVIGMDRNEPTRVFLLNINDDYRDDIVIYYYKSNNSPVIKNKTTTYFLKGYKEINMNSKPHLRYLYKKTVDKYPELFYV
jgi:hypothetical protein